MIDLNKRTVLFLLSALLLIAPTIAQAQQSTEQIQLTAIKRQLALLQDIIGTQSTFQVDERTRYYFDYSRLSADLSLVSAGIDDYLTPKRAQPRDPLELIGDYKKEQRDSSTEAQ